MKLTINNGFLYKDGKQVEFIDTPNKSSGSIIPRFAILHYTADINPASTKGWFKNPAAQASAHVLVDREGNFYQFAKFTQKCWHAGESRWGTVVGLNSFSIGIEMTNAGRLTQVGDKYYFVTASSKTEIPKGNVLKAIHKNEKKEQAWQTYTEVQVDATEQLAKLLYSYYNLEFILGHDDISPVRKSDPGPAFPMDKFSVAALCSKDVVTFFRTKSNLNMRVGAGTNFKVTEVIPQGISVIGIFKEGDWTKIDYKGRIGWVSNKYLIEAR